MAQPIELPGEASPLNHQTLLQALALAASSTQQQIQAGAQQLQNWEKQEKYYTFLQVCIAVDFCLATGDGMAEC